MWKDRETQIEGESDQNDNLTAERDTKSPKRRLRIGLALAAGVAVFIFLLSRVSLDQILVVARRASPPELAAVVAFSLLATVIRTVRFATFFSPQRRWLRLYGVFAASRVANMALPFRSGEVVTVGMLKKNGFSPSIAELAPVWLMLRLGDIIGLAVIFIGAVSLSYLGEDYRAIPWIVLSASVLLLYVLQRVAAWQANNAGSTGGSWASRRLGAMRRGLQRTTGLRAYVSATGLGVALWASLTAVSTSAQLAFGTPLTLPQCVLVAALALAYSMLPINPPMGIGAGEAVWTGLMVLFGVDPSEAIALAITIRVLIILTACAEGLLGLTLLATRRGTAG